MAATASQARSKATPSAGQQNANAGAVSAALQYVPAAVVGILKGRLDWRAYLRSLQSIHTEAVFSRDDPLPGMVEVALVPYLSIKRGF